MLCQNCGKRPATTYVKKTINGKTTEIHLCGECAAHQGLNPVFGGLGLNLDNFWGSLFAEPAARAMADTVRCEGCGKSFSEIADSGKVGCAACYTTFYDRLLPSIQSIHGKARHTGKVPAGAGDQIKKERELDQLRKQLADCIAKQDYENCAKLRDRIQELEGQGHDE